MFLEEEIPPSVLSSPGIASAARWPLLCVLSSLAGGRCVGLWAGGSRARKGQGESGTFLLGSPFWETGVIWKDKRGWGEASTP